MKKQIKRFITIGVLCFAAIGLMGIAQESVRYTDHLIPNVTNTYNLGEAARAWATAYLTTINLAGTSVTSTAAELNILDGVTATYAEINLIDGSIAGTAVASKALALGANKNIDTIVIADGALMLGAGAGTAVTATAAELNLIDGSTAGTVVASKALVVDASKQLNELTITGTATIGTLYVTAVTKIATPESTPVNAVASQGTITMTGIATANETFVISTQTFTWKASRAVAGEVAIGATAAEAVTNIVSAVTADLTTVTAVDGAGDTVVVTAATKGVAGNDIVFTEASTNMAVDGSGKLGATTAGVDGTVGTANEIRQDASYIYVCILANTIADTNWRRVGLGSAY